MTDEQITKLSCDAYAFLKTAELASHSLLSETTLAPQKRNSLLTVITFNFGVSLELTLKLLYAINTQKDYPHGHGYKNLFDKLPSLVQTQIRGNLFQI